MGMWFEILLDGMTHVVDWLKSVDVFVGVSLWSFILTVIIQGIVITALINVVKVKTFAGSVRPVKEKESAQERSDRLNYEAQYKWYIEH